jgi:hypothetical protein
MRKTIEFQKNMNHTALMKRGKQNAFEDLVLVEDYRKYRHRFEPGKTKIRLLPAMAEDSNWILEVPTLQTPNARHAHPRSLRVGADSQSVFDLAFAYMKARCPNRLFSRTNKSGLRLLPSPLSICWAIIEDGNGIRLRLLLSSHYDGSRGGANGLGNTIYNQVLSSGNNCDQPGHPLNPSDGVSLVVERIGGGDTKYPSYRVSLADDRCPLELLLGKITDTEHNALCPLEEIINIMEPEDEWRLLAKVVGDDLATEIRAAQHSENFEENSAQVATTE